MVFGAGGSQVATYTVQLLRNYPLGATALSSISSSTAGYACSVSAGGTSQLTATGCSVSITPTLVASPTRTTATVSVTYATFTQTMDLTILHPRVTLAVESATLRVLSPAACAPGAAAPTPAPPRWQSAALYATAHFETPDDPSTMITVDVSSRTPISSNSSAVTVSGGRVTASAAAAAVEVSVDATRGVNPEEATVRVDVLADTVCVDPLRMVMASVASAEILQQTISEVTVRLTVSQRFEDPGDTGVAAVYAHSAGDSGVVLSEDVTSEVSLLCSCTPSCSYTAPLALIFLHCVRSWLPCGLL